MDGETGARQPRFYCPPQTVDENAVAATAGAGHTDGTLDDLGPVALRKDHRLPGMPEDFIETRVARQFVVHGRHGKHLLRSASDVGDGTAARGAPPSDERFFRSPVTPRGDAGATTEARTPRGTGLGQGRRTESGAAPRSR